MGAVACLPVTLRRLSVLTALLLCGAASLPAARAQGAAPRPATDAEMGLYTRIGAVNACIATGNGVDFNKAVGIASETVTQVLQGDVAVESTPGQGACFVLNLPLTVSDNVR